jgi:hypothetical protein
LLLVVVGCCCCCSGQGQMLPPSSEGRFVLRQVAMRRIGRTSVAPRHPPGWRPRL